MAESLLASLYSRIKGSQEDVATVSLQYILSSSEKLNAAFNRLLSDSLKMNIDSDVHYTCQSVGEDKERPDMSGVDSDGNEVILCEMKFYAGLTDNQPNGYLNRLVSKNGKALVFVCPEARKISLWRKVTELCKEHGRSITEESDLLAKVDGIAMTIVTWSRIIDELRRVAASDAIESKSDIDQFAGFCSMMDSEAFLPYSPEDLGSINARREERNYQVIDRLFDKLVANKSIDASGKGLKASAWRGGYTRYIKVNGYCVALLYNRFAWMNKSKEDTPFWFYFSDGEWKQNEVMKNVLRGIPASEKDTIDNKDALALHPMLHATLDEVADDMMQQILDKLESLKGDE